MTDRKPAEAADQELHIFEADPNAPDRKRINPLLKLALELGPLLVFFFANSKGAWIAESSCAATTTPRTAGSEGPTTSR